jgi:hypothetical protein
MTDDNKATTDNNSQHKSSVAFSMDEIETSGKEPPSTLKRMSKRTSKRNSFFNLRSLSFRRYEDCGLLFDVAKNLAATVLFISTRPFHSNHLSDPTAPEVLI